MNLKKTYKQNRKDSGFSLPWVLGIVVITSIISALTTGVIIYNDNKITNEITYADLSKDEKLSQFLEVYANITSEYYEDVNKEELLEKAIAAMMNYLGDDYSTYLDNTDTSELVTKLSGEYTGIGVSINNSDKSISKVYENTPASEAGIKEGDIIIGYNGKDVTSKSASDIVALIKENKSDFSLKLQRGDETIDVTLKNAKIISPSIDYKMIENTTTGYIYIETFSNTLETQVSSALKKLEAEGMTSLIIDLRDNTGGYLDAAASVTSLFTEKGKKIYSLNYKNEVTNYFDKTSEARNYPIVVLINDNTASASEIMAAALKESYGATLIGTTSFGKGKVQQTMKLDNGSMIKYTSAYWLTPNGTCIDQIGITPDYQISNETVKNENDEIIEIKDKQLEKAIESLNSAE